MEFLGLRAGGDSEVVAQPGAQLLVDAQRLCSVAFDGERLHDKAVGALAIWLEAGQFAARADGSGKFGAADPEAGVRVRLGGTDVKGAEASSCLRRRRVSSIHTASSPGRNGRLATNIATWDGPHARWWCAALVFATFVRLAAADALVMMMAGSDTPPAMNAGPAGVSSANFRKRVPRRRGVQTWYARTAGQRRHRIARGASGLWSARAETRWAFRRIRTGRHTVEAIPRLQTHATRDAMIRCRAP